MQEIHWGRHEVAYENNVILMKVLLPEKLICTMLLNFDLYTMLTCINFVLHPLGLLYVSGKLPTYPFPKVL